MPDASKPSIKSSKADPVERIEAMLTVLEDTFADLIADPISDDMLDLLRARDSEPVKRQGRPWLRGRR
jgi:hypothetical protein